MARNVRRDSISNPPHLGAGVREHFRYSGRWASLFLGRDVGAFAARFMIKAALTVGVLALLLGAKLVAFLIH